MINEDRWKKFNVRGTSTSKDVSDYNEILEDRWKGFNIRGTSTNKDDTSEDLAKTKE